MPQQSSARRDHVRVLRRTIDAPPPIWQRFRLLFALLTAASLVAASAAFFGLRAAQPATVEVRHGTVEVLLDVDAVVVRKEKVYIAPTSGQLRRLAAEGQRVRVGASVAQVVPGPPATGKSTQTPAQTPAQAPTQVPTQAPTQAPTGASTGQDPLRRQIDALSNQIYQTAVAVNKAKANGDAQETARLQAELDSLATRQYDLAQQLGRQTTAPVVAPAP
ncbi:MAG TPA: HlyD family efflux transporter periplasmic adaptor subunit, partial [Symbiobacteriaceae bacterium]|nr:HlyD family efflux transporter periplasmic adaptor subunit [Symbiobacteriaceae bacterium]